MCVLATSFIHLKNIAITTLTRGGVNACVYKMQLNLIISHDCIKCWFCWMQTTLLWMNFSSGVLAFQLCNFSMFPSEAFIFPPLWILSLLCAYMYGVQMVVSNILNGGSRGKSLRFIMNSCVVYIARISPQQHAYIQHTPF